MSLLSILRGVTRLSSTSRSCISNQMHREPNCQLFMIKLYSSSSTSSSSQQSKLDGPSSADEKLVNVNMNQYQYNVVEELPLEASPTTAAEIEGEPAVDENTPIDSKLLRVAIVGVPNAGKSTLVNTLINSEICPVSKRVHTTRRNQKAIYLEEKTQLVFVDTPGLIDERDSKKFTFPDEFSQGPDHSVRYADLIAVIHDVSNKYNRFKLDLRIIKLMEKFHDRESILLLNKVDVLRKKRKLLESVYHLTCGVVGGVPITSIEKNVDHRGKDRINKKDLFRRAKERLDNNNNTQDNYAEKVEEEEQEEKDQIDSSNHYTSPLDLESRGWPKFQNVFMLSARTGEGIEPLREFFISRAQPNAWRFKRDTVTDTLPQDLAVQIVKSKMLEYLPDEVPYSLIPKLQLWSDQSTGVVRVVLSIETSNERHYKKLIGQSGVNIQLITSETEKALTILTKKPIDLYIHTKFIEKKKLARKE